MRMKIKDLVNSGIRTTVNEAGSKRDGVGGNQKRRGEGLYLRGVEDRVDPERARQQKLVGDGVDPVGDAVRFLDSVWR